MKKVVTDLQVKDLKVLVRVDFNVPHKGAEITDDNRIVAAIPTIAELVKKGAKVVLMSHLGKVAWKKLKKGEATMEDIEKQMKKNDLSIALDSLKKNLEAYLGHEVAVSFSKATRGAELKEHIDALKSGDVLLVQNTRYEAGEEKNDPELAKEWASYVDAFVMDAFGCVDPKEDERPYIDILGGAKVSSKIEVIDSLLKKCDKILIGGGMSYTFKKAVYGIDVGCSLCEDDQLDYAKKCFETGKIMLSVDTIVGKGFDFENPEAKVADTEYVDGDHDFPEGYEGLDIGPKTRALYEDTIKSAKTIFWNGPMGVFENDDFQAGTKAVCEACAEATKNGAFTVIGGGDSAAAAKKFGYTKEFSHVSTGGGASLELIQYDGHLPGIDVIEDK